MFSYSAQCALLYSVNALAQFEYQFHISLSQLLRSHMPSGYFLQALLGGMIPAVNSVNAGNRTREHQARCSRPYLTEQDSDIKNVTGRTSNFGTQFIGGRYLSHLLLLSGLFSPFNSYSFHFFPPLSRVSILVCASDRSSAQYPISTPDGNAHGCFFIFYSNLRPL